MEHNSSIDFAFSDMALSVSVRDFKAEQFDNVIRLSWVTESEDQNQGFFVERRISTDSEWHEISTFLKNPGLRGQGNTTYRTEYEYLDSTAQSGFTYEYRLGDVDYNTAKHIHHNKIIRIEVLYSAIPEKFSLNPAYPNPFNPFTTITYNLPKTSLVRLNIYDINGNLIRKLVNGTENRGKKRVIWDSRNEFNKEVPSGMYIYALQAGNFNRSKKILLIR
jgi:hypothetical protein